MRPPPQGDLGHYAVPLRSSRLQESLQRWGTHGGAANSTGGWWEQCHGNGFSLQGRSELSPVLTMCSRPPDCSFSSARLRFLLLPFGLQGPRCFLPSGRMCWGEVTKASVTETKHFPAGTERLSTPKSSWGQGIFV